MQIDAISIHFGDETMYAKWDTPVTMARVDEIYTVIVKFLKAESKDELVGESPEPEHHSNETTGY